MLWKDHLLNALNMTAFGDEERRQRPYFEAHEAGIAEGLAQ